MVANLTSIPCGPCQVHYKYSQYLQGSHCIIFQATLVKEYIYHSWKTYKTTLLCIKGTRLQQNQGQSIRDRLIEEPNLLGSQNARALLFGGTLPLQALVEGSGVAVVSAKVVQVLDLVETDDPVLTGERLLEGVELRALCRQSRTTNPVNGLTRWEERLVVVVGHFVPEGHQLVT